MFSFSHFLRLPQISLKPRYIAPVLVVPLNDDEEKKPGGGAGGSVNEGSENPSDVVARSEDKRKESESVQGVDDEEEFAFKAFS